MSQAAGGRAYPRFSQAEFDRRRGAVRAAMEDQGLGALVLFGNRCAHHEVQYLSNYAVTFEAALVFPLEGEPVLLVHYPNHVPNAARVSVVEDVRRLGPDAVATVAGVLREKGRRGRIGLGGPVSYQRHAALAAELGADLVDFGPRLARMRRVKSPEEIAMIRRGAELSDLAIAALEREVRVGLTEHELAAIVEGAYVPLGGTTHIHFIGVTSMAEPDLCCPSQTHSDRPVRAGDVILTEISAQVHGYYGQVLRTLTVASEAAPVYREMHDLAMDVFDRSCAAIGPGVGPEAVLDVAESIHGAGYTIEDDLVHCAVGGVYAPYLRTRRTALEPQPSFVSEEGMVLVVQPNVITSDERMGVQFGEMVQVTASGVETLHAAPRRLLRCG